MDRHSNCNTAPITSLWVGGVVGWSIPKVVKGFVNYGSLDMGSKYRYTQVKGGHHGPVINT